MKTNLITELSLRIYNKIGKQQLLNLLIEGLPLITNDELIQHIQDNFDEYLTKEEQDELIIENIYHVENEKVNQLMTRLAIELAACYVLETIEKILSANDFVKDNPYSVLSNPQMFMLHKYFDEEMGIKVNPVTPLNINNDEKNNFNK